MDYVGDYRSNLLFPPKYEPDSDLEVPDSRRHFRRASGGDSRIIDWWAISDPVVTKVANWHARLNIIALIVFGVSLYLRLKHYGAPLVGFHLKIPFAVSVVGWLLMAISAGLGGKRVYEHRLGVNEIIT